MSVVGVTGVLYHVCLCEREEMFLFFVIELALGAFRTESRLLRMSSSGMT